MIGSQCGKDAWALAQRYFGGQGPRLRPAAPFDAPAPDRCGRRRPRRRGRRRRWSVSRSVSSVRDGAADRASGRRISSTRPPPSGVDHTYDGRLPVFGRGRRRGASTATATVAPTSSRRWERPAALYRNDSPSGRTAAVRDGRRPGEPISTGVPAPTRSTSTATGSRRPGRPARRRERRSSAGSAGAGSNGRTRRWAFAGGDAITTAFSATWEGVGAAADPRVRQLRRPTPTTRIPITLRRQRALPARRPSRRPVRAPIPLTPGFCALSMLFSDWDRSGRRDLRISNDRQYYSDWRRAGPALAHRAGEPPRLYTAADGWVTVRI